MKWFNKNKKLVVIKSSLAFLFNCQVNYSIAQDNPNKNNSKTKLPSIYSGYKDSISNKFLAGILKKYF